MSGIGVGAVSAAADRAADAKAAIETHSPEPTADDVLNKTAEIVFKGELLLLGDMFRRDILPQRANLEKACEDQGKKAMDG